MIMIMDYNYDDYYYLDYVFTTRYFIMTYIYKASPGTSSKLGSKSQTQFGEHGGVNMVVSTWWCQHVN
jgi:hypothetical protein